MGCRRRAMTWAPARRSSRSPGTAWVPSPWRLSDRPSEREEFEGAAVGDPVEDTASGASLRHDPADDQAAQVGRDAALSEPEVAGALGAASLRLGEEAHQGKATGLPEGTEQRATARRPSKLHLPTSPTRSVVATGRGDTGGGTTRPETSAPDPRSGLSAPTMDTSAPPTRPVRRAGPLRPGSRGRPLSRRSP